MKIATTPTSNVRASSDALTTSTSRKPGRFCCQYALGYLPFQYFMRRVVATTFFCVGTATCLCFVDSPRKSYPLIRLLVLHPDLLPTQKKCAKVRFQNMKRASKLWVA